jgi:hypothetical protein
MSVTHLPVAALLGLLASSVEPQSLPSMDLLWQCKDGNAADIVGPSEVAALGADLKRVWGLQGRRRSVWRIDNRERQNEEEDFDFATKLSWGAIDVEGALVEHRLFTLSEKATLQGESGSTILPAAIKVDDISTPSDPDTKQLFTFPSSDAPRHIASDPERNLLIVVMGGELRIYNYNNSTFTLDPAPLGVAPIPTGLTSCGQDAANLGYARVVDLQVGPGGSDERVAIVAASIADPPCDDDEQLAGVFFCNIEDPSNPSFYATDLSKQAWQPCRDVGDPCSDWRFHGLTHLRTAAGRDLVYVVGAK